MHSQALRKQQLIAEKKLGKFGKILDTTPQDVREEFGPHTTGQAVAPAAKTGTVETLSAVGTATPTITTTPKAKKVLSIRTASLA